MKVVKAVGHITGKNGTGFLYEVENNGAVLLATIYPDGTFHPISLADVKSHVSGGLAQLDSTRTDYQTLSDSALQIENPGGWARLYTVPVVDPVPPIVAGDDALSLPVNISFSGTLKLSIGGLTQLLKILE